MKPIIQKLALLAAMLSVFIHVSAFDFEVDGICYTITDESVKTVEVTCFPNPNHYKGDIIIPESVSYKEILCSVMSIGKYAFAYCSSLKSVTIPNSVTSIGEYAFFYCSNLKSVTIPNSVTSIGKYAFCYCSNLKSVTIPNSVMSMGEYAFSGCSNLKSVTIPNSVTSIGKDAFSSCSNLKSVTIPNSVTSIGEYAFSGCSNLKSVTIPNSVTSIGKYAFFSCSNLKSVTIPNSVTSIGKNAFSLKKAIWLGNTPPSEAYDFAAINYVSNNQFNFTNQQVYPYLSSCFEVGNVVFVPVSPSEKTCDIIDCNYNGLKFDLVIDNTVSYKGVPLTILNINDYAFYANDSITSVDIKFDGNIGNSAFENCHNVETAIVNNRGSIGNSAFQACALSNSLTIGNNVTSIGQRAFCGYYKYYNYEYKYEYYSKLSTVIIPDNVKTLGKNVFESCNSLKSVTIGKGLTELPDSTFSSCNALENIKIPSNIGRIGDNVFVGCSTLSDVTFEDSDSEITLGYNSDSSPLFADCPLDEVYIGRKLSYKTNENSGYSPFYRNTSLRSVKITDAETQIYNNEFYGCSNLQSFECGDGVTKIGNWAFSGCSAMKSYASGSKVESIGKEAFSDCTSLTSFTSMAAVPPTCGDQALDDINKWECTLYIPVERKDEYMAAPQWKEFFFIEESGIDDITADGGNGLDFSKSASGITLNNAADARVEVYGLDGRLCRAIPAYAGEEIALNRGVYIVRVNGKSLKIAI